MIDLHVHTTASDGLSTPEQLIQEAKAAGLHTVSVCDHDTMAAVTETTALAKRAGLSCVAGIEITAVLDGRDVHILGYFLDPENEALQSLLAHQLEDRRRRLAEMAKKLADLGVPVNVATLESWADTRAGKSVGRPLVARALVEAGHVPSVHEAFERYLSAGRPAFVERRGLAPKDVCRVITGAKGLSSLAHPGKLPSTVDVEALVNEGFDAIEVFHPDHSSDDEDRFRAMAESAGILVTGGSDYHGGASGRVNALGRSVLPADDFVRLVERATWERADD